MDLHGNPQVFVPDNKADNDAFARITHLGIGAHQDDLEFMALHGILACYETRSFAGVTCTNGTSAISSSESGERSKRDNASQRREEQNKAATLGQYGIMIQLDLTSKMVREQNPLLQQDLQQILSASRPRIVYTHNPVDKHDTHVAVVCAVVEAIRDLSPAERPSLLYGCEVWRDLDWLPDDESVKVLLNVGGNPELARKLNETFQSQIYGESGKRYDLAVEGRRRANATFAHSHQKDTADAVTIAMDLTPLINSTEKIGGYVDRLMQKFYNDVQNRLSKVLL